MKERKFEIQLTRTVPGTTVKLVGDLLIPTCRTERQAWAKLRGEQVSTKEAEDHAKRVVDEHPFTGRIPCFPQVSTKPGELLVLTKQAYRILFEAAKIETSTIGGPSSAFSFEPLDPDPESKGKGYCVIAAGLDNEYALTILSKDRKRSLIVRTPDEGFISELLKVMPPPSRESNLTFASAKAVFGRLGRVVDLSESLTVRGRDHSAAIAGLIQYRSYVEEEDS